MSNSDAADERSREQAFQETHPSIQQGSEEQRHGASKELEEEILASDFPRLYFSTEHHLYALVYKRTQRGYKDTPFIETPNYQIDFLAPLVHMPFTGESWSRIIAELGEEDESATLVHLSPNYGSLLGHFTLTRPNARPLDACCLILVRPSHTTEAIAKLLARDGELWRLKAADAHERGSGPPPPPQPNSQGMFNQDNIMLYDVFARGRLLPSLRSHVRLPLRDAIERAEHLALEEQGLVFRYAEPEDMLEWLNPQPTLEVGRPAHPLIDPPE